VMLRHAVRLNTLSEIALTKLDVLAPLEEIKICVAYEDDAGTRYDHVPYHQSVMHKVRPIYETLPGWGTEIDDVSDIEDLPVAARDYMELIERLAGVPISFVSVGPGREQTVVLSRAA
jgi:adenylosuccinate synthase